LAGPGSHKRFSAWFRPHQRRAAENTDANRNRVHEKIAEARMSTGNCQLSNLDTSAKYHGHNARQPLGAAVSDPEGNPVQKKYAGMFDLMGHKRARPVAGRNQRKNNNSRQSEPRRCAADSSHHHTIPISTVLRGSASTLPPQGNRRRQSAAVDSGRGGNPHNTFAPSTHSCRCRTAVATAHRPAARAVACGLQVAGSGRRDGSGLHQGR
jgi:hypothetical protein